MKKAFLIIMIILLFPISIYALDYPKINSKNVEIYDLNDQKILYEIKSNEKTSIASLTKIATAITAIENIKNLNDKVTITSKMLDNISWNASKAGIKAGDKLTHLDLLYALMLPSGADAANSIAILNSGNINNFVKKMNALATKIELKNTNFVNVTGLDEENHYSTVDDVIKLLKYALQNQTFKKIFTTKQYKMSNGLVVKNTIQANYYNSKVNTSKILGGKTGHTEDAGYCLSSLSNINGHEMIIVVLHAQKKDDNYYNIIDTTKLIDFLEKNYKERILIKENELIKTIKVKLSNIDRYDIKTASTITKYLPSDYNKDNFTVKYEGSKSLSFLNIKGNKIGTLKYYYDNQLLLKEDVILNQNIKIDIIKIIKTYWYLIVIPYIYFVDATIIYVVIKRKKH